VKRREFITLLGGAAAWPLAARAQQPVIGYLHIASPGPFAPFVGAFRQGLREAGYVEGQNLAIEYRWAEGRYDRLPAMAAELVGRQVSLIAAQGGAAAAAAAQEATGAIPIVFSMGGDPVKEGIVASLSRPGGNVTGISVLTTQLAAKRLEIMREVVPKADVIAMLVNPTNMTNLEQLRDSQEAGRALGLRIHVLEASSASDFDPAFAAITRMRIGALVVGAEAYFHSQRERIVALAMRHAIPTIYEWREFADAGGLMSYGTDLAEGYRLVGVYAGRILKGAKPAELPVMQATKVQFVVNLKTAKALGLTVPLPLLGRADEVIE
jgi:putative tryptophan/tyrosine transport system substrate-binding protein